MASPLFRAASAVVNIPASGNGPGTLTKPAGLAEGDLLMLVHCVNNGAAVTPTLPVGAWGATVQEHAHGGSNGGVYIYMRLAGPSEPATYDLTHTTGGATGFAQLLAWSGVNLTTPIPASAKSATQNGVTTITAPTVTAPDGSTLVCLAFEWNLRFPTITAAAPLTSRSAQFAFGVGDQAIATGASIAGRTLTGSASGDYYAFSFVIAGAASASDASGNASLGDVSASGGAGGGAPTVVTGNATLDEVAAGGGALSVYRSVTTLPFSRNPGNGGRITGLTGIALAVLSDDVNLQRLAGATSRNQAGDGTLTLADAVPGAVGQSVIVVTREADGKLGVERYLLT